jgi:hypothetical protein
MAGVAHFLFDGSPTTYISANQGQKITVELFAGGPCDQAQVVVTDPSIASISEVLACTRPNIRTFTITATKEGTTRLQAGFGSGLPILAETRMVIGKAADDKLLYYHGTSLATAKFLMDATLTPMIVAACVSHLDWTDYTDFGKGFYTHKEENSKLAFDWAKRNNREWGVVEFCMLRPEDDSIKNRYLFFRDKKDRPYNAPVLSYGGNSRATFPLAHTQVMGPPSTLPTPGPRASWLEFVEFNRGIRPGEALIARPNDKDWSGTYAGIVGPIWVPRDSGFDTGGPKFPDDVHQVNWGQGGLKVLNTDDAVARRFLYTKENEPLFLQQQAQAVCP